MKLLSSALIIFTILFASCRLDEEPEMNQKIDTGEVSSLETSQIFEGQMILGNPINHPYRVPSMQVASNNMRQAEGKPLTDIETSHYYVKFKPKDWVEMEMLTDDTTVILFSYPLNVEIKRQGGYYHDPKVPKDKPTYQYAVVPVDYEFPSLKYSIKEELYLPELIESESNGRSDQMNAEGLHQLEKYAWELLTDEDIKYTMEKDPIDGDGLDGDYNGGSSGGACSYCGNYNGLVTVWDNEIGGQIPVHGVKVRLHRIFYSTERYTDNDGIWSITSSKADFDVTYKWERNHFSVREGDWVQAQFSAEKIHKLQTQRITLNGGSVQAYHAHIFQAAYDYYYGNRFGLTSPPENTLLLPQIKIAAKQIDVV